MGKELVALLGCRIQAHRIIHPVICAERDLLVAAVDAAGAGVDQVLDRMMPASLQDVVEPDHVALDVRVGVFDAIADTGLSGKVHDDIKVVFLKEVIDEGLVSEVALDELVGMPFGCVGLLLDLAQAVLLERRIIVVVQVVKPHDVERLLAFEESQHKVGTYEAGRAGDEEGLG